MSVTASRRESKPIRLSAASENCIWPVCGDAQPRVPAPAALAPCHSAYAVSSRMTLSCRLPRPNTLSMTHSRTRLLVSASCRSPSGARSVSMLPVTRSSPANKVRRSRPVSAARSSREKRSSRSSAPHFGGSMVTKPVAVTLPISPLELGVHDQAGQGALAVEAAADVSPRLERRERAADALEGERLECHVGHQAERVGAGVEMDQAGDLADGPIAVLMLARTPGRTRC